MSIHVPPPIRYKHYSLPREKGFKVLRAFFLNRSLLSCIMGPVGGGKSLAAFQRCIYFARMQAPHPLDKVRRTKWVIIRAVSYTHLTLPTM
jgi:hypothetical protein